MFQHGCPDLNSSSLISLPGLNPHVRDFPRVIFGVWSAKGLDPPRPALGTPVNQGDREDPLTSKTSHNDSGDGDGPAHDNFPDVVAACDDDAPKITRRGHSHGLLRKTSGLRILTKNVHVTVFKYLHMYVMDKEKNLKILRVLFFVGDRTLHKFPSVHITWQCHRERLS